MRYFIRLSFNGKNYHGWQVQQNAHSVQAELDKALAVLLKSEVSTLGCGRTDTGVHAKIFYAHFDHPFHIENQQDFIHHLNCLLPYDIAVREVVKVADDAHARFDAVSRTYEYFLYHRKNPFMKESAYFFPYELDITRMNEACLVLMDYSDYSSFSKNRTQVKTKICEVKEAVWKTENELTVFRITANRFLRNMVRAIVGTMMEIGEHKIGERELRNIIEGKNRSDAGFSVPAHGLYLAEVKYDGRLKDLEGI